MSLLGVHELRAERSTTRATIESLSEKLGRWLAGGKGVHDELDFAAWRTWRLTGRAGARIVK
ncbi:MAG: hypothetical protein ABI775_05345 [Pseudonocardiales bacterium]